MNKEVEKAVGSNIRRLREKADITQEQLSARLQVNGCDITRSALAKIEVGQRHLYPDEIILLKKLLGVSYDDIRALTDTAHEVRRLRAEGISVICIFTGEDVDLPSARMVYGQDFVRIRDHSLFADTVGKLIIDQMKSYST